MRRFLIGVLALLLLLGGCTVPPAAETEVTVPTMDVLPSEEATTPTTAPTEAPTEEPTEAPTQPPTEPEELPTEPTEPTPEPKDTDLVRVIDYIPTIHQELRYATTNNFTGKWIYDFSDAYLRYGTVKKLAGAVEELAQQGLEILIWDGFRPTYAQALMWEFWPDPSYVSHPTTGNRPHCRGNAIDMTLVDLKTGEKLEMPSDYDVFNSQSDRNYSDCTEEAAANAKLLEEVMRNHGFIPYDREWWHFTDSVYYDIEYHFDPEVPSLWYAAGAPYIHLRAKADKNDPLIASVAEGDPVQLRSWSNRFALVRSKNGFGYIPATQIRPADSGWMDRMLDRVKPTDKYSYEQMLEDLDFFARTYPDQVRTEIIGKSELGRDIPVLRIGREDASKHVLFQGAIHGREHMTAWLLMAMADYWLDAGLEVYGDICYHIIPMSNPDGVVISQTGTLTEEQMEIYQRDLQNGYLNIPVEQYASLWKANGLGIDVNRNFPADWEYLHDRMEPSCELYQGAEIFASAESRILRDYVQRYEFDVTISYHASGGVIYYAYGRKQPVNTRSASLGNAVSKVTGYQSLSGAGMTGGGFKDWVIDSLEIPSLTIEIGCEKAPLAEVETLNVFVRNYRVITAIARWLQ